MPPPQETVLVFLEIHYIKKEHRSYLEEKAIICVLRGVSQYVQPFDIGFTFALEIVTGKK
jgi:hypothetical protein